MRRSLLVVAVSLPLAACGWFGGKEEAAAPPPGSALSSDDIVKRNCADENWKKQNLGLWYSVCRQPMKW